MGLSVLDTATTILLRREGINGDWVLEPGFLIPAITRRAHATDLIVVGQADPDTPLPASAKTLVEDILMTAGRPLLLIPYAGRFDKVGTNVLVGWTPTRESARAVHDALPKMPDRRLGLAASIARNAFSSARPTSRDAARTSAQCAPCGIAKRSFAVARP